MSISKGSPCPSCLSNNTKESMELDTFLFGVENPVTLEVEVPVISCKSCGLTYSDERASEARHIAACEHQGLLTHIQIREIRENIYNMSQEKFAESFGFPKELINRWENRYEFISLHIDNYLRLLQADKSFGRRVVVMRWAIEENRK
jgi:DNA-binding transcriptional regulator YiaG